MKKILICAGTRPEAVKMAPVVHELNNYSNFRVILCSTGQHNEMLYQTLNEFGLEPEIDLHVMTQGQNLGDLTARLFEHFNKMLDDIAPDIILVQGDTTSVMVASLCAYYRGIPLGHIEAGLRSFDIRAPFPEEVNRKIAGMVADLHFAPTPKAAANLHNEGVDTSRVYITGNTVIDALLWTANEIKSNPPELPPQLESIIQGCRPIVLITGHRRENFGNGFKNLCEAITTLAKMHKNINFVYPVHLNPNVRDTIFNMLSNNNNIFLTDPLAYRPFVRMMQASHIVLTDSGGIQEEAPGLNKPVIVTREVTERQEGVEAGTCVLVGTNQHLIIETVSRLLTDVEFYESMTQPSNPYGDGKASQRIARIITNFFTNT